MRNTDGCDRQLDARGRARAISKTGLIGVAAAPCQSSFFALAGFGARCADILGPRRRAPRPRRPPPRPRPRPPGRGRPGCCWASAPGGEGLRMANGILALLSISLKGGSMSSALCCGRHGHTNLTRAPRQARLHARTHGTLRLTLLHVFFCVYCCACRHQPARPMDPPPQQTMLRRARQARRAVRCSACARSPAVGRAVRGAARQREGGREERTSTSVTLSCLLPGPRT